MYDFSAFSQYCSYVVFKYFYVPRASLVFFFLSFCFLTLPDDALESRIICKLFTYKHIFNYIFRNPRVQERSLHLPHASAKKEKKRKSVDDANYVIIAVYTAVEITIILLITEWYR